MMIKTLTWLRSRGTFSSSEQQFGSWMRADHFSQFKKFVVDVQGYDKSKSQPSHRDELSTSRSIAVQPTSFEVITPMVAGGSMERVGGSEGTERSGQAQSKEDFQAILQEIEAAIHRDNVFKNPESLVMESQLNSNGKVADLQGLDPMPGTSESPSFSIDEDSCPHVEDVHGFGGNLFNPGWTSKPIGKKVKKVLGPGSSIKAQQTNTSPTHEPLIVGTQKLGTWTRISRERWTKKNYKPGRDGR